MPQLDYISCPNARIFKQRLDIGQVRVKSKIEGLKVRQST
tara:strand:- start:394 stop:513 length:120 start_codon:yes stop_codon:yes gene_type:complete